MENTIVNSEKYEVSTVEKVISFLFPLIGLILYLCLKDSRNNPNAYLRFAGIGVITCVLLTCLSTCVGCVATIGTLGAASPY